MRPTVKSKVRVLGDYRRGEVGVLVEDDRSDVPFKVEFSDGKTRWYCERNIEAEEETKMKLEVFGAEKKAEEVVRLKLVDRGDRVTLMAVDEKGDRVTTGNILYIDNEGYLHRISSCHVPGLKVDGCGQIIIKD